VCARAIDASTTTAATQQADLDAPPSPPLSLRSHPHTTRAFVSSFITPLISAIWGGASFESLYFTINGSQVSARDGDME
jgi:hypothetical protein